VTWVDLGQFIAIGEDGGEHTWKGTISNGMFTDCNPNGDSPYGADISTRPAYGHEGIGSMLYGARKELVLMKRMISGWRLFNSHDYADKMSASEYADKVINGELNDPVLSFELANGFKFIKILPNYLEPRSRNCASFIEWLNPLFRY